MNCLTLPVSFVYIILVFKFQILAWSTAVLVVKVIHYILLSLKSVACPQDGSVSWRSETAHLHDDGHVGDDHSDLH